MNTAHLSLNSTPGPDIKTPLAAFHARGAISMQSPDTGDHTRGFNKNKSNV